VVTVADEEWFGPDGTQAPPADPMWQDPLGGLVTGSSYLDPGDTPCLTAEWVAQAAPEAVAARRRLPAKGARRPGGAGAPGAMTPQATAVAASLPSMTRQQRRPTTAAPTQVAMVPPARNLQSRAEQLRNMQARNTPARVAPARNLPAGGIQRRGQPKQQPQQQAVRQRKAGAGCSIFVLIVVVMVIAFIVLGIVLGHGDTSGGFGGGGG
jgi:cobalamin biosynthesis Mg chelatase CobN